MKKHFTLRSIWISALALLCTFSVQAQYTQLPECTAAVPFFELDLSANPNLSFTTPEFNRQPGCCGETDNNDDYVSFYVTLHPDVAMFELVVAPGYADPPGAGIYNIVSGDMITLGSCGTDIPGGAPVCITGSGPHKITYLKPGNNKIKYIFRQIPKPIYPLDQPTRIGCTLPLPIYGLNNITISAIAKSPNLTASLATANTYMSCLNCVNPVFEPGANATYPYTITYQVTGTPQAAACGSYPTSGTFTVTVHDALNVSVTPDPGTFCAGGPGVVLTASATGGDSNYSYSWVNSEGVPGSLTNNYLAPEEEIYTVQVADGLVSPTCPTASYTVSVIESNTPIVNAGPDLTACQSNSTTVLNGSVQYANALWVGGNGTFSPGRTSAVATYTPTLAEVLSGSVTLTLTSTGAGGGCIESSDDVTILYSANMTINETIGSIVCNGQTTSISTSISGGIPGYTYQWTTGATTSGITVPAGTYSLTVTDQFSCTVTENFTVNQPSPINLTTSSVDETAGGDGSVSITIAGGDAPYNVVWTDALDNIVSSSVLSIPPFTNTVSPLGYGYYTATVTDGNGCEVASSVVVNSFACSGLGINISAIDVDCYGASTGSVTAAGFGGITIPSESYSYSWSSGQTTATVNGLPSGVYTVTITDDNNPSCSDVASIAIFQPTAITNTITQTDVTVQGGNDGTATANPLGGTPIYTYEWNTAPLQTSQTATGLMAGTYSVEITDSEGCTLTDNVLINEPPCNDFLLAVNTTNVLCNGENSGSASLFITNGTPPFAISWSSGETNVYSVSNLTAGSYSVDVTDDNGCFTTKNFTITEPNAISLGLDPTNSTCFGSNNGTIDLTVSGGTYPQYYYTWVSAGKEIAYHQDLVMLPPGTYTVTVTDENGCSALASIGITQPAKLEGSYTYTDNLCFGQSIGSVNATITGGTLPYSYDWSGPSSYSATTEDISGLATGLYELSVMDGNNCEFGPMLAYISQPELLIASAIMTQEVSCAGATDGAANLTVLGGTLPYSYAWTGPSSFSSSNEDLVNVGAGNYSVIVTDVNSCSANTSVTITTVLDIIDPIVVCPTDQAVNTSSSSCTYTVSGTSWNATATDECYLASLNYVLTGATTGSGTSLNGVAFNLGVTTVTWTATDGLNNTDVCSYTVTVSDATLPILTNCVGNQAVNSNSGVCTYTVSGTAWDATATDNCTISSITANVTGATVASGLTTLNNFIFNLGVSTVTWTVTDGSGNTVQCVYTVTVADNQNPVLSNCVANQPVNTNSGVCTYTVSGNAWNATATDNCSVTSMVANVTGATTASGLTTLNGFVFNLGTSTVTWVATDGTGNISQCSFNVIVTDNQLPSFTTCVGSTQNVNVDVNECNYTVSGTGWDAVATDNCSVSSLLATLTGATTGSGLTTLNNVNFNVGTTTVTWTAMDGSGNTQTCIFNVVVTDNILPSFTSCGAVGNQTVNANAGLCTYTHPNNTWNAIATDNCSVSSLSYTLTGVTTGTGTTLSGVTFNLGTTTVTWTAVDASSNISTCAFNVTVLDNQDPVLTSCIGITQFETMDTDECNYTNIGTGWDAQATDNCSISSILADLTGATTANDLTTLNGEDFNLGTTTVTWTVTDGSGNDVQCIFNVVVTDDQDPEITTCVGSTQTVDANAGVCTYTVSGTSWDAIADDNCTISTVQVDLSGATIANDLTTLNNVVFNLGTTAVTWTVTDQSGNTDVCTFNVVVEDNEAPVISNCPTNLTVSNDNGDCGAVVSWTLPTYTDNCGAVMTYSHLPGSYFNVGTTVVTYTVTDGSGNISICSFDVTVDDNENPILSCSSTIETCDPFVEFSYPTAVDNCGALTVIQTAGLTSGVNYPVGTTINAYSVTDIHGNTSTCNFSVVVFPVPVISFDVTQVSCNGFGDGEIDATITVGTAPYTYTWTNGASTEDLTDLIPGTYSLTVIDDNGCTDNAATMITEPAILTLSAEVGHVSCYNGSDANIDLTIAGGTTPYTYDWNNGATSQDLNGIAMGTYDVIVSDANGCIVTFNTSITEPDSLMLASVDFDATCGSPTGTITVNVTGGTNPYTFDWSDGSTGMSLYNVVAGIYTLNVIDANGCSNSITDTISTISSLSAELSVRDAKCYGDYSGEITATVLSGYAPFTYEWTDGQSSSNAINLAAGAYAVTITDIYGCEVTLTATVNQPDSLYILLSNSVYSGGYNISQYGGEDGYINSTVYGGTSPYDYSWFGPQQFISDQPNISNLEEGAYLLTVVDANGCKANVSSRLTQPDILEMPNGYSPNGDKDNEYFVVHGIDAYPDNTIQVYNRWGNLVYELDGYNNEWNGDNMNGEPLPDATYFVVLIVRVNGEDLEPLTGYVDLRR